MKKSVVKETIHLWSLAEGMPGLSKACAETLAEAASVCLDLRLHGSPVECQRAGLAQASFLLDWPSPTEQQKRSHADIQEATERGACGISILVVHALTGKVVIERSRKGTGFDYWLGDNDFDDLPFQGLVRLEISGILAGSKGQVSSRIKQKKEQIATTDHLAGGIVAVFEFGMPLAHIEYK